MTAEEIVKNVAALHGTTLAGVRGPTKHPRFVAARREAARWLLNELGLSHAEIGRLLGGRCRQTIQAYISDEVRYRRKMRALRTLRLVAA